ncbi:MAG: SufD family Fe-S cluster assembly protein [Eubacterium sp.]|nr:SufD family Fe-S cluster assembly protein [Eubacterium sp.]
MTEPKTIRVNQLPAPTWNWLRLNDAEILLPEEASEAFAVFALPEREPPESEGGYDTFRWLEDGSILSSKEMKVLTELETGMGEDFQKYTESAPVDVLQWRAEMGKRPEKPFVARVFASVKESTVNRFFFSAEDGSDVTIVMDMTKEDPSKEASEAMADEASGALSMTTDTRIYVRSGARVRLIQVCHTLPQITSYVDVGAYVEDGGSLEVLQISLGGAGTFFGVAADLAGKAAHLGIETGYQAAEGCHVDMNYIARHHGERTTSEMNVKGVLWKGASKNWRATIDFLRGCKGAKGSEREDVLLLDEDVVNKSIPLILCQEEDVEGEHGATIGDLSDEVLLYFRSRGIDDETAYQLMAKGRLIGCVRQIPDEALRAQLMAELGEEPEEETE